MSTFSWGGSYSTEEQIVGTWIDGKPIYQVAVTGTVNTNVSIPISNLDIIPKIDVVIKLTNGNFASVPDPYTYQIYYDIAESALKVGSGNQYYSGQPFYAVIQYTKTTD